MSESLKGAFAVALASSLWGLWKVWFQGPVLDPAAQGGLAILLAGCFGTAIALRQRRSWPDVPRWAWAFLGALGLCEAVNCGLYFRAISEGDIATGVTTHYLAPVIVALVSPLVREPMGRRAPWAAAVAFLATLALVGFGGTGPGTRAAAIEGAGSAAFYAAIIFLSKRVSGFFRPWEMVGFHDIIAGPFILMGSHTPPWSAGRIELTWIVVGAIVSGTIGASVYFYGLARIPAARTAVLSYTEPVAASMVGVVMLHESLPAIKLLAMAAVILAGVAVATEPMPITRPREQPSAA